MMMMMMMMMMYCITSRTTAWTQQNVLFVYR
jgi:hypothetical protein